MSRKENGLSKVKGFGIIFCGLLVEVFVRISRFSTIAIVITKHLDIEYAGLIIGSVTFSILDKEVLQQIQNFSANFFDLFSHLCAKDINEAIELRIGLILRLCNLSPRLAPSANDVLVSDR